MTASERGHRPKPLRRMGAAKIIEPSLAGAADSPVHHRPDGYYWEAADGRQVFGPFPTPEAARADRDRYDESGPQPGEGLDEAESEIGIADWIDPDTGEPAEGLSPPHIEPD